jgi:dynein intermediate chain 1
LVLTGDDPNSPKNISKFSFKDQCYKLDPPGLADHMAIHLVLEGSSLHVESSEFILQKERLEKRKERMEQDRRKAVDQTGAFLESSESVGESEISLITSMDNSRNQFNFSNRASQTLNNALSNRFVCTEPPPVAQYSANITQWDIYDSYIEELRITSMEHQEGGIIEKRPETILIDDENESDLMQSETIVKALRIVERLVNQNAQDEIYQDFKYWEDDSDQFRQGEGSLLPLWRFAYERTRRKQVTALCWNPKKVDLFAVGYGSYDFLEQGSGMICCYSIKNTSHPEYMYSTRSGVYCLDFHPQHASLLAVGLYDGSVAVYDVTHGASCSSPIYSSSLRTGTHSDPVWQVHWQKEEAGKELNFYSISSDGRILNWSMSKNDLLMEPVIQLKLDASVINDTDDSATNGLAGGCCFDFSDQQDHLFLVGTEEGNIYKCSKAYSGQYLETYEGHHMAVYSVKWNPFHPRIFISCSADWTVKVSMNLIFHFYKFGCSHAF